MRTIVKNGKKFNINENLYKRMSKLNLLKEDGETKDVRKGIGTNVDMDPSLFTGQYEYEITPIVTEIVKNRIKRIKDYIRTQSDNKNANHEIIEIMRKSISDIDKKNNIRSFINNIIVKYQNTLKELKYKSEIQDFISEIIVQELKNYYAKINNSGVNVEDEELRKLKVDDIQISDNTIDVIYKCLKFIFKFDCTLKPLNRNDPFMNGLINYFLIFINFIRKKNNFDYNIDLTKEMVEEAFKLMPFLKNLIKGNIKNNFNIVENKNEIDFKKNKNIIEQAFLILAYSKAGLKTKIIENIDELLKLDGKNDVEINEALKKIWYDNASKMANIIVDYMSKYDIYNVKLPEYNKYCPVSGFFDSEYVCEKCWRLICDKYDRRSFAEV